LNVLLAKPRGIVEPTVFAVVGVIILIGLGIWQLDRKTWKENLIATITTRISRAPVDLPPRASWPRLVQDGSEYTRVVFPAEFLEGQEALVYTAGSSLRPDVKGQGYWVFAPAQLAGGSIVLVNRGFVPADRKDPATRLQGNPRGTVDIVGVMRWPETRGTFTPADDVGAVLYRPGIASAARRRAAAGQARRATARQSFAIRHHLVRARARAGRRLCGLARGPLAAAVLRDSPTAV